VLLALGGDGPLGVAEGGEGAFRGEGAVLVVVGPVGGDPDAGLVARLR
jgi:hypothetical protein